MTDSQQKFAHTQHKLPGLELLRFAAALSVLVWHYQHFFYVANQPVGFSREQQPLYASLRLFYDYGFYGVQVFWCISGFVFFWKYQDTIAKKTISARRFFVLRFSRLYPLHLATLLLVLALQSWYFTAHDYFFVYQHNDLWHLLLQLFLASSWGLQKGDSFNGPIWSISVEVLVYCCFFLSLRFFGRSSLVSILVLLLYLGVLGANASTPLLDCLGFFYAGGLAATALKHTAVDRIGGYYKVLALCMLIVVSIMALAVNDHHDKHFPILFLLFFTPLFLFLGAPFPDVSPGTQKLIEAAGNMTYSSYLMHFPIQLAIAIYFAVSGETIPSYSIPFFCSYVVATLITAYLVNRYFELPFQRYLRKRWG